METGVLINALREAHISAGSHTNGRIGGRAAKPIGPLIGRFTLRPPRRRQCSPAQLRPKIVLKIRNQNMICQISHLNLALHRMRSASHRASLRHRPFERAHTVTISFDVNLETIVGLKELDAVT